MTLHILKMSCKNIEKYIYCLSCKAPKSHIEVNHFKIVFFLNTPWVNIGIFLTVCFKVLRNYYSLRYIHIFQKLN